MQNKFGEEHRAPQLGPVNPVRPSERPRAIPEATEIKGGVNQAPVTPRPAAPKVQGGFLLPSQALAPDPKDVYWSRKFSELFKLIGNAGQCRSCSQPGWWVTTRKGKPILINTDGTVHFSNCPQADRWRKK